LKTDKAIQQQFPSLRGGYNGVMFSSKWLADDMDLQETEASMLLKSLIDQAHRDTGFVNGSPADWWVIVLADGDGMGSYISGENLNKYNSYLVSSALEENIPEFELNQLLATQKRMGPATHVGLNRALLDFSNRLVPYLTEKRFCGRVIYSGGDDVLVVLPLEDLPEYILSLHAAWCGGEDLYKDEEFKTSRNGTPASQTTGYWHPTEKVKELPQRPHFTMGAGATMSMGVVIAHKSVPLPTVLSSLWEAEGERAKEMPGKDGICFRVIYGGGNQLEALMKGQLLEKWWELVKDYKNYQEDLSPLLYRLAEELPRRAVVTENDQLFSKAAKVIMASRDKELPVFPQLQKWLDQWEDWAKVNPNALGTQPEDLGKLLRFTAFWVDKRVERHKWKEAGGKRQ
jgi:CRISPR-associated protein Cmr2